MHTIVIPAHSRSDLKWDAEIAEAQTAIAANKRILWKFDLGMNEPFFPLEEELRFQSLTLALSQFTKDVWPLFQEHTEGGILFEGSADFSRYFSWTSRQEENWALWKEGRVVCNEVHERRLFCAEAFIAYFQMLAHRLPDELPLTLRLDAKNLASKAETLHLLSPDRFEHFLLEIEGNPSSPKARFGVCFPEEAQCSGAVLVQLNRFFSEWTGPFRAVPESMLTQYWDELDDLYVLTGALSGQGRRKLMGFCAAGGRVIAEGELLGLLSEVSAEEYFEVGNRGRGIRTPDLLVPNQPR